ncbi:CoA ester lyase [Bradyrhizobium sp. Pear76]|uniref:HpcH/HpaI aldolase/citrate lyase family protein n=1 Tax=Bradyrhizobium oropedii TaxID=1571201 RepID=UPI001E47B13D|nr:CoA ester lyase [Bradyrhizobium oropedii]MCC8967278.1 CoA ester lyase [Bradyrhizobium oropedii]
MRSFLFVPADSIRKFEKASASPADALILDLEDSVALGSKAPARTVVREMLGAPRGRQDRFVRINSFDTGFALLDLAAVMSHAPDGIVLPKCEGPDDLRKLDHYLDAFEATHGVEETKILPIVTETAASLFTLGQYRNCSARLWGMMWGAEDLAASLGSTSNILDGIYHEPFRLARNLCLAVAAAAGVVAVDAICTELCDLSVVRHESEIAKRDGFQAKAVIHPKHVEAVNRSFAPNEAEVSWARKVIDAFEAPPQAGTIRIDGKMVDLPHKKTALAIIAASAPKT